MLDSTLHLTVADDGTRIAWRAHRAAGSETSLGAARPIVLTNGLSTTDNFWRALAAGLAGAGRVVHWFYRGHGESQSARSHDYSIRMHARDLERVTEDVRAAGANERAPVHVAFSMGVTVLLELYRARPDLVGAMVLIAGGADGPHVSSRLFALPGVRPVVRGALRLAAPIVTRASPVASRVARAPLVYSAARALGAIGPDAPRAEVEHFFRSVGAMDLEAYWESLASLFDAHASDVLPAIRVPVLIVAPERDLLASRADLEALRRAIPGAEWLEVPHTTHAMLLEAGPRVADRVREFVARV